MKQDKLQKLADMLKLLERDTISSADLANVLAVLVKTVNTAKANFDTLSAENIQTIKDGIADIERLHDRHTKLLDDKTSVATGRFEAKLAALKELIAKVKTIKPIDGVDGVDGRDGVDGKDGKDGKDGGPDTREQIVEKINTGKKKDLKIEAEQIGGLDKLEKGISDRALSILDQRTKFLINKGVKHDNTLSGEGTDASPLSVIGGGGGGTWGSITGTLSDQTDLQGALDAKQDDITGTDTHVLFFDGADTPAGDADFTFNKTTQALTLGDNAADTSKISFNADAASVSVEGADITFAGGQLNVNGTDTFGLQTTADIGLFAETGIQINVGNNDITMDGTNPIVMSSTEIQGVLVIPNGIGVTVDADGEVALEASVTDFSHGFLKYFSGEEMAAIAVPVAELTTPTNGAVPTYNSTTDEFELVVPSGSGDVSKVGTPVNNQVGVWTGDGTLEGDAALTFDTTGDVLSTGGLLLSGLTASEIVGTDASKNLVSLAVATYPSLTELAYVKGVTSAVQTQLNAKLANVVEDTTPQLGGALDANGFGITDVHAIQLDGTPDTDHTANGPQTNTFAAGYSSAIGDLVFFGSGGKWLEVDSDAVATCNGLLGIALEAKTDTQAMLVALPGSFVRDDTWNWTVGATLYAGETLGAMQETIPTGADAIIKVVGFAVSADVIFFNPSPDQQSTVA